MILTPCLNVMPSWAEEALKKHFGSALSWQRLEKSSTAHCLFIAQSNGANWIARIDPGQYALPGVDAQREAGVLAALTAYDWAVEVELSLPEQGVLLMPYAGEPLFKEAITSDKQEIIIRSINQMHKVVNVPVLDYAALFEQYRRGFRSTASELIEAVDRVERLLLELPDIGQCLVHHDLHAGNMIWNDQLTLIDWEYAGLGTAWFDYAMLKREFGLSLQQLRRFDRLMQYSETTLNDHLSLAVEVLTELEKLWQQYRVLPISGERDVNYQQPVATVFRGTAECGISASDGRYRR